MSLLGESNFALIATTQTNFGGIIPDVTVTEIPRDALIVTEHPVERGAAIADHAFVRPTVVEIQCGFSNASAGEEGYIDSVYQSVLRLQGVREPFDLYTARRRYPSMLLESIVAPRDEKTNSVLNLSLTFRQINIAYTQQASAGSSGASADAGAAASTTDQSMPGTTSSITDTGAQQAQPYSGSLDSFAGTFSTQDNTTFSSTPDGLGLSASGASAGFDVMYVDGQAVDTSGLGATSSVAPGSLGGNVGMFGNYAPGAFGRSPAASF